ncbi:macrophage mannose receptor 1-like [Chrysemys picta bellii]|uniref:macrophage mannose receptor 1-like n=1 Tax=Chrysemys picta bellii TaxID=8478 RepID=UPI0032B174EF
MEMASALERMQVENQLLQDVASGSFLIYSESHQLCVDVTAGGSLTAAPCAPGSPSQHFQWLSRGQLLNVAHQQCVAVPKQLSRMAVRLEPCEAHRELQHWECRADGLLALAKENLYFNYGNNQNHVVMLYTGNGPWSRWVVYGSHEDLCFCSSHGEFCRTHLALWPSPQTRQPVSLPALAPSHDGAAHVPDGTCPAVLEQFV